MARLGSELLPARRTLPFSPLAVPVVILLADGVRPDVLAGALDRGELPALARLRADGGLHTVASCFPSVTGPAYAPFLMGRFPGAIGLPGLRWFDRARAACSFPDYTRSYVGHQMLAVDRDIAPDAPTIFELCGSAIGALSVISRGLPARSRIGTISPRSALRAMRTHFSGNVAGWLQIDREVGRDLVRRIRTERPDFVFAAFTGVDKVSHAAGHAAPMVLDALRIVDDTAATIREDAERLGYWDSMSLWVVSDHGHSSVRSHEDLAALVAGLGFRTVAHPWVVGIRPEVAVMVSGNAMAHLYLDIRRRERPVWPDLAARWGSLAAALLERPSVDLVILPRANGAEVRARGRGAALVTTDGRRFSYRRESGDPLAVGADLDGVSADAALEASRGGDYPDGVVQLANIAVAPRAGEIILSASRDWDFRARYEPIPHVSSHGALHREHMLVPLLLNRPAARTPLRTVDVMPSALAALGKRIPAGLDGTSFV
jgi:Type I phosphodiesterase / nucleotide pyrophosphatase